jgi:LPS sulfotransferase NodH
VRPKLSYTIWFSQRTGSSLLCEAIASTGLAGKPGEWLNNRQLPADASGASAEAFREKLWQEGTSSDGIFGLKIAHDPSTKRFQELFKRLPDCPKEPKTQSEVWDCAFPNGKHLFMTRRNKVRLAVSWWRAIQGGEWHRKQGTAAAGKDLKDAYLFPAIQHLILESDMREAAAQEFFSEAGIVPMTLVYEDFIADYEGTVRRVLDYLGLLPAGKVTVAPPHFEPIADEISEAWVQRFRQESQKDWPNKVW